MLTIPWTISDGSVDDERGEEVVVLASRLQLDRVRDVPGFLRAALAIRRQVLASPGAIGVSLVAQPARKTFWTLSAWTGDEAIGRFVGEQPHRTIMAKYHDRLDGAEFTTWTVGSATLPGARSNAHALWSDGKGRLAAASTILGHGEGE